MEAVIRKKQRKTLKTTTLAVLASLLCMTAPTSSPAHSSNCSDNFSDNFITTINPTGIKGGHHAVFPTLRLANLDNANTELERIIFTFVIRGRHGDLKKLKLGINGIGTTGKEGRELIEIIEKLSKDKDSDLKLKHWWKKRHFHVKHDFDKHKDSLVVSLDLSELLINAQEQFRPWFQKLIHWRGQLMLSVTGSVKMKEASLTVVTHTACHDPDPDPDPEPDPAPDPDPDPTPTPVAPDTFIDSKNPSSTNQTTMSFTFSSNQSNVLFNCSLDANPAQMCTSPVLYSGLESAPHRFQVVATNASGLSDATAAAFEWVVDTIAPVVNIDSVTPSAITTNASSISISFSSNEVASFQCSLDGGAYLPCNSPVYFSALLEGPHEVGIIGTDGVGNTEPNPAVYKWNIDQTAPVTTILQVDPAAAITNLTDTTFTFGANETATFECSIDGLAYQSCSSPLALGNFSQQTHSMAIRATDVAGNQGLSASYAWTVDQTAPVLSFGNTVPTPGITNATGISVQFISSESASYSCSIDGAATTACTSPFTAVIATEGVHTFSVAGTDGAGNISNRITASWMMDYSNPQISFGSMVPSAANAINTSTLTVNVNATEPVTYGATFDGLPLNQRTSPIILSGLSQGTHSLVLTGVDSAGNLANTITHSFNVDLTAPVVSIDSVAVSGVTSQNFNTIQFSADEAVTFECNFNAMGFSSCQSPFSVAGLMQGTHTLWIRAVDTAGNMSAVTAFSWTVDQTSPSTTITAVTPSGAAINQSGISVTFITNDPVSTSACSLDGSIFSACLSPYLAQGLPDGAHTIQIRSADSAGNTESTPASYGFTVDTTAPVVSLAASVASLTKQTLATFAITVNEASTFTCLLDDMQVVCGGSDSNNYANLADGLHSFSVTAMDVVGNLGLPVIFNWTIDTVAPQTSLTATQAPNGGNNITFSLSSNEANSTYDCSMDGALFTACSATQGYTDIPAGSHIFVAKATDAAGNTDPNLAGHSFVVADILTTSITSVIPTAPLTSQTSITFGFASNAAQATFLCALDSGASTACTSPKSYASLSNGAHTFVVRAVDGFGNTDANGAFYSWTVDTLAPLVVSASTTVTSTSFTVNWTTNKPTTTGLYWGAGTMTPNTVPENSNYTINHTVTITGLNPLTAYSYVMIGSDLLGNFMQASRRIVKTAP